MHIGDFFVVKFVLTASHDSMKLELKNRRGSELNCLLAPLGEDIEADHALLSLAEEFEDANLLVRVG